MSRDDIRAAVEAAPELTLADLDRPPANTDAVKVCERRPPQSARLVELAASADLFKNADGEAFADIHRNGHRETHRLRGPGFKDWIAHRFYQSEGRAPSSQAFTEAMAVLDGQARFEGVTRSVFVRVGHDDDGIYLDLGRDDWSAVMITKVGWVVVSVPSVRFRRPKGLLPLPVPATDGQLAALWDVLNIGPEDRPLVLAWLVMLLHPHGPYPILVLRGEQGTGKTDGAGILKAIVDPGKAALRSEPREIRDLMIGATNSWLLAFDNLSSISPWLSDAMCRLATGGSFAVREHYENAEEALFEATRPMLINGIPDIATRSDLLDRCIIIETRVIDERARRTRAQIRTAFEAMHAGILGAVLDGAAVAFGRRDSVHLDALPRMADFALWATAAEPALDLPAGAVVAAINRNRADAHGIILDATPIGKVILQLVKQRGSWRGTPENLRNELMAIADDNTRQVFPKNAKALSDVIRRIAPNLRAFGVNVFRPDTRGNHREWCIERARDLATVATVVPEISPGDLHRPPDAGPSLPVDHDPAVSQLNTPPTHCDGDQTMVRSLFSGSPSQPSQEITPDLQARGVQQEDFPA